MKDLPIYEITFDEFSFESGIDMIAITKDPAIKELAMRFSNHSKELFNIDKSQRLVVGPVLIPDLPIYRNDNGFEYYVVFTKEVIHKMVNKFSKEQRSIKFNIEHTDKHVEGFIKEQWIIESDTYDKSKMYGMDLPIGTYMISAKIENDNDWNLIKEMDRVGFSIEGYLGKTEYKHKLKKETNMKKRKFFKLEEEDQVIIVQEGLPIGSAVETLDENLEVIPMPDGTYEIDETTKIVVVDGKIEEVITNDETNDEVASDVELSDEIVSDVVSSEQDDQLKLISDRLDNIVELIASIQLRLDALESTEDSEDTITESEFSLSDALFALTKTKN